MDRAQKLASHPCFNPSAAHLFGRVHLPVAPDCNMQCNYCNRKHDCINESRPGVTSAVLTPGQAIKYLENVTEAEPRISVVGIAGPGDPFASPTETMDTLQMVRDRYPEMILCIASNGLNIGAYIDELARLNLSHVTITVNAVDPRVTSSIYAWAREGKKIYRKADMAQLLLDRQIDAIKRLKEQGIIVKVNSIIIPGVNDAHIPEVAKRMSELGVDLLNCMPMYPTNGSEFEGIAEPSKELVASIRKEAAKYVPQMLHCTRCRADAVGLLGDDKTVEMAGHLKRCSSLPRNPDEARPYVAVASREGALVNQHLGEAEEFRIYSWHQEAPPELVEARHAPEKGGGDARWRELADTLSDCRAVLVSAAGAMPLMVLKQRGIETVFADGLIEDAVNSVFRGEKLKPMPKDRVCRGGWAHGNPGGGCG